MGLSYCFKPGSIGGFRFASEDLFGSVVMSSRELFLTSMCSGICRVEWQTWKDKVSVQSMQVSHCVTVASSRLEPPLVWKMIFCCIFSECFFRFQVSFEGEVPYLPNTSCFENCQKLAFLICLKSEKIPKSKRPSWERLSSVCGFVTSHPEDFRHILLRTSFRSKKITPDFLDRMKSKKKETAALPKTNIAPENRASQKESN